jgi:pimeloyl-ACP methyl ester carboxylesterase
MMIDIAANAPIGSNKRPQILLIHGAFHGSWVWQKVLDRLAPRDWRVHTVDLPSVAAKGQLRYGLLDDAAEIRRRIEAIDGPVVVVAHSYGGMTVTQAASGLANVRHIIYIAAFLLDVGESVLGLIEVEPPWWIVDGDTLTAGQPLETFFADVAVDDAARAVHRLQPSSYSIVTERLTAAAWRDVPSTYVICEQDQSISLQDQEHMAQRATNVRRLPSSHSPMLSRPAELAQIIVDAAVKAAPLR